MAENKIGNLRENLMISKIIFSHGKQYFVFKIFCSAHKKTSEMKELAPNKQLLKILAPNSQKQKS